MAYQYTPRKIEYMSKTVSRGKVREEYARVNSIGPRRIYKRVKIRRSFLYLHVDKRWLAMKGIRPKGLPVYAQRVHWGGEGGPYLRKHC